MLCLWCVALSRPARCQHALLQSHATYDDQTICQEMPSLIHGCQDDTAIDKTALWDASCV